MTPTVLLGTGSGTGVEVGTGAGTSIESGAEVGLGMGAGSGTEAGTGSRVGASVCDTHLEAFFKRSFLALLRSLVTTFACSHCQSVSHGVGSRSFRPPSWIF